MLLTLVGPAKYEAPRGQKKTVEVEEARLETHSGLRAPTPLPPGMRLEPFAEPLHWFIPGQEALYPDDGGAPSLSLPVSADRAADGVDSSPLRFLAAFALEARREEEETRRKREEQEELNSLKAVPLERCTPQQVERITDILLHRWPRGRGRRGGRGGRGGRLGPPPAPFVVAFDVDNGSGISMAGYAGYDALQAVFLRAGQTCLASWTVWTRMTERRSSSLSAMACALLVCCSLTPRVVFLSVVVWPKMLRIMAGMHHKVSYALFGPGSGMCKARFVGILNPALCSSRGCHAQLPCRQARR